MIQHNVRLRADETSLGSQFHLVEGPVLFRRVLGQKEKRNRRVGFRGTCKEVNKLSWMVSLNVEKDQTPFRLSGNS